MIFHHFIISLKYKIQAWEQNIPSLDLVSTIVAADLILILVQKKCGQTYVWPVNKPKLLFDYLLNRSQDRLFGLHFFPQGVPAKCSKIKEAFKNRNIKAYWSICIVAQNKT